MRAILRFGREVAAALALMLAVTAVIAAVVEGAERGGDGGWRALLLAAPDRATLVAPLAAALAGAHAASSWLRGGQAVGFFASGRAPSRLVLAAALAAALVVTGAEAVREGVATLLAEPGAWRVAALEDGRRLYVHATWDGDDARDLRLGWTRDGALEAVGTARAARWTGAWTLDDAEAWSASGPIAVALPPPWRLDAAAPPADGPVLGGAARPGAGRVLALGRALGILAAAAAAGAGTAGALRGASGGRIAVVAVTAGWLLLAAALGGVLHGGWPLGALALGATVPPVALALASVLADR